MANETDILVLIRDELRAADIGFTTANCYCSAITLDLPEGHALYAQVIDNGGRAEGDAGGGADCERVSVRIAVFVRLMLDPQGKPEQILINASKGIRAMMRKIKAVLHRSDLGGELDFPLLFQERRAPVMKPGDQTWIMQELVFDVAVYERSA